MPVFPFDVNYVTIDENPVSLCYWAFQHCKLHCGHFSKPVYSKNIWSYNLQMRQLNLSKFENL